ncbi:hypothetical protein J6590_005309 [Homalodisca vitripennis]|nr:hypothetical protein J6590_005309 [Homalodisca vitripennis]
MVRLVPAILETPYTYTPVIDVKGQISSPAADATVKRCQRSQDSLEIHTSLS